jgi:hypothetical protein
MAQVVSLQLLSVEALFHTQVSPYGFMVDKFALGQGISLSPLFFSCQYHSSHCSILTRVSFGGWTTQFHRLSFAPLQQ